jgi:hypothetical protein
MLWGNKMKITKIIFIALVICTFLTCFVVAEDKEFNKGDKDNQASVGVMCSIDKGITTIEGKVYNKTNDAPIKGLKVSVFCEHNNKTNVLATVNTDKKGIFKTMTFNILPNRKCIAGDSVWITTQYQGTDYSSDKVVVDKVTKKKNHAAINLAVGVPEFTTGALAAAVVVGSLGLAFLRKR